MRSSSIKLLAGIGLASVMCVGVGLYYLFGDPTDRVLSILKDILFFVLSAMLSYAVAISISRSEYKRELERLGNVSVRRVGRLSENIREVAKGVADVDEQSADELFRIARDADETNKDILLITELEPASQGSEALFCPHCGFKDSISVPEHLGASDSVRCRNCRENYNIHRVSVGLKIVPTNRTAIGTFPQSDVEKVKLNCPNEHCSHYIKVAPSDEPRRIMCFNCYTSFEYDFDSKTATDLQLQDIVDSGKSFSTVKQVGYMLCPRNECMEKIPKSAFIIRNLADERFALCKGCHHTIMAGPEHGDTE